jgi:hypothetical protein
LVVQAATGALVSAIAGAFVDAMVFVCARSEATPNAVVAIKARVSKYRFMVFIRVRFKLFVG